MSFTIDEYERLLAKDLFDSKKDFSVIYATPSYIDVGNVHFYMWLDRYTKNPKNFFTKPPNRSENTILVIFNKAIDDYTKTIESYWVVLYYRYLMQNNYQENLRLVRCMQKHKLSYDFTLFFFPRGHSFYYENDRRYPYKSVLNAEGWVVNELSNGKTIGMIDIHSKNLLLSHIVTDDYTIDTLKVAIQKSSLKNIKDTLKLLASSSDATSLRQHSDLTKALGEGGI